MSAIKHYPCQAKNKSASECLPVVLVHGWGLGAAVWDSVIPELTVYRDVYTLSLPGYDAGNVERESRAFPTNYFVIGFSLGGVVASNELSSLFNGCEGLITVSTNAKFIECDGWPCALARNEFEGFSSALDSSSESTEKTLRRFAALQCKGSPAMREEIAYLRQKQRLMSASVSVETLKQGLECLLRSDLRETWRHLPVPALHQFGRYDSLVPLDAERQASQSLGVDTEVFKESAHQPFLSEPQRWVESVNRFAANTFAKV